MDKEENREVPIGTKRWSRGYCSRCESSEGYFEQTEGGDYKLTCMQCNYICYRDVSNP